jgi:outer membrane protein
VRRNVRTVTTMAAAGTALAALTLGSAAPLRAQGAAPGAAQATPAQPTPGTSGTPGGTGTPNGQGGLGTPGVPGGPGTQGTPSTPLLAPATTRTVTLDEAVRMALKQNPTLDEATAAIRRAEAAVAEARSFQLPRLDGDARFTYTEPIPTFTLTTPPTQPGEPALSRSIALGRPFTRDFSAAARYDPDPFGRLRAQTNIARRQVNVARGGLYVTQNELVYAVQNVYLAALRAHELVGVQQEALVAAQEQLRVAEAQLRAGTAPEFDVLRARVQVENVRQNRVSAQSTELRTLATLGRLLSLEPTEGLDLVPVTLPTEADAVSTAAARRLLEPVAGTEPAPVPQSLEVALSEAFTRRPELYRAEWSRRAAEARVRFEQKGNLPGLGFTATGNYNPDATGFAAITESWSVVANVTIPIWDAGLTRARTREARADVSAARAQERAARDTVTEDVKQNLVDLQAATERRQAAAANTAQAREALRIAQVRYTAGLAPNVEVTDAEAALTQARANEVNSDYDYLASLAALNRSLGRYAGDTLAALRQK